ncbi:MAG TPA: ABC transporter permease [Candidatus Saccharimonadales bacterium]|nr:ABC transporter permease [Candidatus Saccharimonadales bacterium]
MKARRLLATASRVLAQLRHDKPSIALIVMVPIMLEVILKFMYLHNSAMFNKVGAPMLGIFPLVMMFVVASVATLRERTRGTLDRLLVTPINKAEFVLGYAIAFTIMAIIQAILVSAVALYLLNLHVAGPQPLVVLICILDGILGMAMGLFVSAYAKTEFHSVQFLPAVIMPQFLLCGLLLPREQMAHWLYRLSEILPLTYGVEALQLIAQKASPAGTFFWRDSVVVASFVIASLLLGAASIRRKTA